MDSPMNENEGKRTVSHKGLRARPGVHYASNLIRVLAAIFCCTLVWPPLSIGNLNIFVLIPGIVGVLLLFWPLLRSLVERTGSKTRTRLYRSILAVALSFFVYTSYALFLMLPAARKAEPPENAVVLVLGAQVINGYPSLILWGRIHCAAEYLSENPSSICIASGGQGPDESISEAQCIRDTLVEDFGIQSERIILEDQSTNTRENIAYSKEIIIENGLSEHVVVATDGFHQYRAQKVVLDNGLTPYALPARSDSRLILPMSIRELFAIGLEAIRPES